MDRRERINDSVEAVRAGVEGMLAEAWHALPCIVQSFDANAITVTAQPAIRGRIERPDGSVVSVNLPLLVDVPVQFSRGGGFSLTFPVRAGDECLVVFADRCIDGWWQSGAVSEPLEARMHNLSDGFAFVGPYSQLRVIPNVSTTDVQLRSDDGAASITIKPDYTINATNPAASINMSPDGEISGRADRRIFLAAPDVEIAADNLALHNLSGGRVNAVLHADIAQTGDTNQTGSHATTGDQVAGGISQMHHRHDGVEAGSGSTGEPVGSGGDGGLL